MYVIFLNRVLTEVLIHDKLLHMYERIALLLSPPPEIFPLIDSHRRASLLGFGLKVTLDVTPSPEGARACEKVPTVVRRHPILWASALI